MVGEIHWPGTVEIGTGILKIGNSSIFIFQKLFQDDKFVAEATTVIVQVQNGKSIPLSEIARATLMNFLF
jgi:acyl-CoA thioester hydrolase